MYHSDLELVTKALAGNTDLAVKSALEKLDAALNERDDLGALVRNPVKHTGEIPEPSQLLLHLIAIMDEGLRNSEDGISITDLEELSMEVRTYLYLKGYYNPDDKAGKE